MQVTVNIPDALAAQMEAQGLTPKSYLERLVAEHAARIGAKAVSQEEWNKSMDALTRYSEKIPSLPIEAFSRESFYSDNE